MICDQGQKRAFGRPTKCPDKDSSLDKMKCEAYSSTIKLIRCNKNALSGECYCKTHINKFISGCMQYCQYDPTDDLKHDIKTYNDGIMYGIFVNTPRWYALENLRRSIEMRSVTRDQVKKT